MRTLRKEALSSARALRDAALDMLDEALRCDARAREVLAALEAGASGDCPLPLAPECAEAFGRKARRLDALIMALYLAEQERCESETSP